MALPVMSAEDTVRYKVYCSQPREEPEFLSKKLVELEDKLRSKIATYMWHVQPFNLRVTVPTDVQRDEAHLFGSVYYGENVDDEWFVAHLFLELTRDDSDLVVQIDDEDGDVFLIEAANHLPKWLTPEIGDNRVYLHRGAIHIVPQTALSEDELTVRKAVNFVRSFPAKTVATSSIQQAIRAKTKDFESAEAMRTQKLHMTLALVPVKAAQMLKDDPSLVADSIRAFFLRSPLDNPALKAMKYFPPEVCVKREVLMSRFNYALLRHDGHRPNPVTGWNIPLCKTRDSKAFIEADLGMKIACGLEILCVSLEERTKCMENNARFQHYIRRLKERNYFQGQLDGSEKFKELYDKAKGFFLQQDNDGEDPETSHQPRQNLLEVVKSTSVDMSALREDENTFTSADDEKWLELDDNELNDLLKNYTNGGSAGLKEAFKEELLGTQITQGLDDFVKHMSGLDGVEVPPVRPPRKSPKKKVKKHTKVKASTSSSKESKSNKEDGAAGVEDLSKMLTAVLDFKIPSDSDDDSSSMSSYGDEDRLQGPLLGDNGEMLAEQMQQYLSLMDKELAKTTMGHSFQKKTAPKAAAESDSEDDTPEVNIPLTALKNILKSSNAARANPGPAQNLLHSMGLHVPPKDSDDSSDEA